MKRVVVILAAMVALAAEGSENAHAMSLGFSDLSAFRELTPEGDMVALENARSAGATKWRFSIGWSEVSPTKPASAANAEDPNWEGYNWARTDRIVRSIANAGMEPVPVVVRAPRWAEGPARPPVSKTAPTGTWRPSASAFRRFAVALAKRYSGSHPDPVRAGLTLPVVRTWQVWNEPNLAVDLTPQWVRTPRGWRAESPRSYRSLVNAFYTAVKRIDKRNRVVTAGTAPYGDLDEGDPRMPPVRFWRELLCVTDGKVLRARKCPRVSFDAIAHHPYPIGPPRRNARNPDDAVVPDVRKITRLLPAATRRGTVRPKRSKPLWITEISWDSRPDPDGLSLAQQATYLQGALYVLYRQGADVVIWFNLRDQAPTPSYAATYQSGIFLRGSTVAEDVPKPSYTAFRFPFTAYRTRGVARLWGMAPSAGPVTIQARQNGRWVTAIRLRARSNRVFTGRLRVGPGTSLRAVSGADTSLVWRTF